LSLGLQASLHLIDDLTSTRLKAYKTVMGEKTMPRASNAGQLAIVSLLWFSVSVNVCRAQYDGGKGTAAEPYQIATAESLIALGENTGDYDKYFVLTADIDLAGYVFDEAVIAPDVNPNHPVFQGVPFDGVLDGNDHSIDHLNIDASDRDHVGLIGYIWRGVVTNLALTNVSINGGAGSGGLCGENNGTLIKCHTTGQVSADSYSVGGLCGRNQVGTISQCYSSADVTGTANAVGGLCGSDGWGLLSDSYATGSVTGNDTIGGLCGEGVNIYRCYALGTVTGRSFVGGLCGQGGHISESYAKGNVQATGNFAGGLCGISGGTVSRCSASGRVAGDRVVGGLCGENDEGEIHACYAKGSVSGNDYVGGLCGTVWYGVVTQSYAIGEVSSNANVGGLCSWMQGSQITQSFWNTESSKQSTSVGGVGLSTEQMMNLDTYLDAEWDFGVDDGDPAEWRFLPLQYPQLFWIFWFFVPDVIGLAETEAVDTILQGGLGIGEISYINNVTVPAGHVISQSLPAGEKVRGGTEVDILVSLGRWYSGGEGTEAEPYQITKVSDLIILGQNPQHYDKHFELLADIDLSGNVFDKAVIASDTDNVQPDFQGTAFSGTLEGNGHTISDLTITTKTEDFVGLFGLISPGAKVENLKLSNAQIAGRTVYGILCGKNDNALISRCYTSGDASLCGSNAGAITQSCSVVTIMQGGVVVGGLCGVNRGTIEQCCALGQIEAVEVAGGLCARNYGTIDQCYARVKINAEYVVGGLCGYNNNGGVIRHSYAAGKVTAIDYIGGLCGSQQGGVCSQSFWDTEASTQSASAAGTGKTTDEMQNVQTYIDSGWQFPEVWHMPYETPGYPMLWWQKDIPGDIAGAYGVNLVDFTTMAQQWLSAYAMEHLLQIADNWLAGIDY
jgi:hypothetical protein